MYHHERAKIPGGVEVRYRVVEPRNGDTSEQAPMLVHNGLVSSICHWHGWVDHFGARRPVVTWDYPGHGDSPRPPALDAIGIEAFADQAHHVLAASGRGPAVVCGLSMGVQVALEHYRRHPDDVKALVLLCGTFGRPLDRVTRSRRVQDAVIGGLRLAARSRRLVQAALYPVVATPIGRELAYLTGGAHRQDCPSSVLDELFAHVHKLDLDVMVAAIGSYLAHSAEDVLADVRVPTLIIAGGADQLTPPSVSEYMRAKIRHAALHVVPGRSHLAQVEEPDTVHRLVEDFLRTV